MVFQRFNLFPHLTAEQNIMEAPVRMADASTATARADARRLLDRVGLGDRAGHYPAQRAGARERKVL